MEKYCDMEKMWREQRDVVYSMQRSTRYQASLISTWKGQLYQV